MSWPSVIIIIIIVIVIVNARSPLNINACVADIWFILFLLFLVFVSIFALHSVCWFALIIIFSFFVLFDQLTIHEHYAHYITLNESLFFSSFVCFVILIHHFSTHLMPSKRSFVLKCYLHANWAWPIKKSTHFFAGASCEIISISLTFFKAN